MSSGAYACGGDSSGTGDGMRVLVRPAFLTKIFNIVSDPNTNSIVSWNVTGDSFIIWDHLQFCVEVIPKHFKHNNFSSFIYQLNNYGFRKIGVEHRWEYEHPYFQAGKEYLLANIKRRNQNPGYVATRKRRGQTERYDHGGPTDELILRNEINETKLEIQKLKRQQQDLESCFTAIDADVKNIERNGERLMMCWAKAWDQILARTMRHDTGKDHNADDVADHDDGKRRKLGKDVVLIEDDEEIDGIKDCDGESDDRHDIDHEIRIIEDYEKDKNNPGLKDCDGGNNPDPEAAIPTPEIRTVSSEPGIIQVGQDDESGDYTCWERVLLEDDPIFAEKMGEKTNGSYPELKDYDGEHNQDQDGTRVKENAKIKANPGVKDYEGESNPMSEIVESGDSDPLPINENEDYMYWRNILMGDSEVVMEQLVMENKGPKFAMDLQGVIAKLEEDDHGN